jgi:hypothetical protein
LRMNPQYKCCIITFLWMITVLVVKGQEVIDNDSTVVIKEKKGSIFAGKPGKSMIMSLVIPGAGQIYNKSYLRVPFVWGAVGGMGWLMVYNTTIYNCRSDAYKAAVDHVPFVPDDKCEDGLELITDPNRLRALRDEANKNRQLSIIGFAAVWLAQGIDAYVDAHLKNFNINDDLSLDFGIKSSTDSPTTMNIGFYVSF